MESDEQVNTIEKHQTQKIFHKPYKTNKCFFGTSSIEQALMYVFIGNCCI